MNCVITTITGRKFLYYNEDGHFYPNLSSATIFSREEAEKKIKEIKEFAFITIL